MKSRSFLLSILVAAFSLPAARAALDGPMLRELDKKLENRQYFMEIKERRIDSLRQKITSRTPPGEQYRINNRIYLEYSTYRYDSAMLYISRNREIASTLRLRRYEDEAKLHASMLLSTAGLFKEAIEVIESIDRKTLDPTLLLDYYLTNEWAWGRIKNYAADKTYSPQYGLKETKYIDSVFMHLTPGSKDHGYYRGYMLMMDNRLDEAEKVLRELLPRLATNTRLYAIATSNLATIYHRKGNISEYETFLILSAMSDQECALKENRSMQELAMYLFAEHPEELERANRYIQYAMEDAQFFNNRVRTIQIARTLPVIVSSFQEKSRAENRNLKRAIWVICLLSAGLFAAIIYIRKEMRMLEQSR